MQQSQPKARIKKQALPPTEDVRVRDLQPDDWPIIAQLFGENGACGGCWCMWPRLPRGGKFWEDSKGAKNRNSFRKLVQSGQVHGVIAFAGAEPIGWCSFGPRRTFPRLETVKAIKTSPWTASTWSIVCFYMPARWRMRGVAGRLLEAATARAFALGAKEVEGYPVSHSEQPHPAAFAWMGVPPVFENAGYNEAARPSAYRSIYRKRKPSPQS